MHNPDATKHANKLQSQLCSKQGGTHPSNKSSGPSVPEKFDSYRGSDKGGNGTKSESY
jgi:hypothetical protein